MNKLRSDVLFNRALLWLMFGAMTSRYTDSKITAGGYLLMADQLYDVAEQLGVVCE